MRKLRHIIWHEYRRHVLRWRFLVVLLSIPLYLGFVLLLSVIGVLLSFNRSPAGYVDHSNMLVHTELPESWASSTLMLIPFQPYPGEGAARAALDAGEIQAYFVVPADYRETRQARLVYLKTPSPLVRSMFTQLMRYNLLANLPPDTAWRIFTGPDITLEATEEQRTTADGEWIKMLVPVGVGVLLMVAIFTSSGYLMQAVVEEKENRTMEILATSASAGEIMNGKILALMMVGLTQILAWVLPPLGLLVFVEANLPFQVFRLEGQQPGLLLALVSALPTFVLISALMATIGATVSEAREGQQVMNAIQLPGMLPFLLMPVLIANPNGPVAVALSFFPLTTSLTLLMRVGFSSVPLWQIIAAVVLLNLSALGALWLSGRAFRLGMLRYGQSLRWNEIFRFGGRRKPGGSA